MTGSGGYGLVVSVERKDLVSRILFAKSIIGNWLVRHVLDRFDFNGQRVELFFELLC